jgi:hypothetical protein
MELAVSDKTQETYGGISLEEWASAYRPEVHEFYVSRFVFVKDGGLVRVALGRHGPPINAEGAKGPAVYSHAITMTEAVALELSKQLRDIIAR